MVDVRESVEEDRGLLKKIQLWIPGFSGYRRREDVRAADSILRLQMADGLVRVREGLEECRHNMLEDYSMDNLDKVGSVINKARTLEGKVRHAEQGYTGFSPAIRIEMRELNRLYEYDASMIGSIERLEDIARNLVSRASGGDESSIAKALGEVRSELTEFEHTFEERIPRIAGIYNM
jgi:hypothetical protein